MIPVTADLHNHSTLCDGHSTPEEMVSSAIAKGFRDFGISVHGYTPFDLAASVKDEAQYLKTMRELISSFANQIRLYCGVEQDFHSPIADRALYDYLIGSVHYFYDDAQDRYFAVDGDQEEFGACINELFGGDPYAMVRKYYENVIENAAVYQPDIIGHIDIIVKNNAEGRFFDEDDKRYRNAALEALVACLETSSVIELNTGAVFRGYRKEIYPARFLLKEMQERKALLTLSADAHKAEAVGFGFEEALGLLGEVGFKSVLVWEKGAFCERAIK